MSAILAAAILAALCIAGCENTSGGGSDNTDNRPYYSKQLDYDRAYGDDYIQTEKTLTYNEQKVWDGTVKYTYDENQDYMMTRADYYSVSGGQETLTGYTTYTYAPYTYTVDVDSVTEYIVTGEKSFKPDGTQEGGSAVKWTDVSYPFTGGSPSTQHPPLYEAQVFYDGAEPADLASIIAGIGGGNTVPNYVTGAQVCYYKPLHGYLPIDPDDPDRELEIDMTNIIGWDYYCEKFYVNNGGTWALNKEFASWYEDGSCKWTNELYHRKNGSAYDMFLTKYDWNERGMLHLQAGGGGGGGGPYMQQDFAYTGTVPSQSDGSFAQDALDTYLIDYAGVGARTEALDRTFDLYGNIIREVRTLYGIENERIEREFNSDNEVIKETLYLKGSSSFYDRFEVAFLEVTEGDTAYTVRETVTYRGSGFPKEGTSPPVTDEPGEGVSVEPSLRSRSVTGVSYGLRQIQAKLTTRMQSNRIDR
jgi:hypothetical protein